MPCDKLYIGLFCRPALYLTSIGKQGKRLACSRFLYALPYSSTKIVLACALASPKAQMILNPMHSNVLKDIGGAPKPWFLITLKGGIVKASRYEPSINSGIGRLRQSITELLVPPGPAVEKPQIKPWWRNPCQTDHSRVYAKIAHQQFFRYTPLNKAVAQKMQAPTNPVCNVKTYS